MASKTKISIAAIAKQDKKFLSKYAALFLTVLGFLAITTAFGALGYKISQENRQNTQLLNAVGLEKTLSQQVSKDILVIQKEFKDSQKFNTDSFASLTNAQLGFDHLLLAFKNGGEVSYGAQRFSIAPLGADYAGNIEKIQNAWSPLKLQIDNLSTSYKEYSAGAGKITERDKFLNSRKTFSTEINSANAAGAPFANDVIGTGQKFAPTTSKASQADALGGEVTKTTNTYLLYAAELLGSVEKLNDGINASIGKAEDQNLTTQKIMSAVSLLLFFVLIFYFIRKNIISDFVIFSEDREKKAILDNINEGLFLMDTDWNIASEGSKFLRVLFGREIPVGANFKQILADSVDGETMSNAERFVNILINKNIKGSMIDSLNPLKLIALNAKDASGMEVTKHVSVHFGLILDGNGKLKSMLVGIQDYTEKHRLSRELKEEIQKNKDAFAMLLTIGKSSQREEIKAFLGQVRELIESSNAKLRAGAQKEHQLQAFLHELKNETHGLKNEAGLLSVDILQKLLHDFEDYFMRLERSGNVTNESLLDLPYQFQNILEAVELISLLVETGSSEPVAPAGLFQEAKVEKRELSIRSSLELAVSQTAKNAGKKARLQLDPLGFDDSAFTRYAPALRTCLIHLIKNSVVHGIEGPAARLAASKAEEGVVRVWAEVKESSFDIHVADDGAGLSIDAIRRRVGILGINQKPIEQYSDSELAAFVFQQGFSTADEVTLDAGRGVGLNYVKQALESLGGAVKVSTTPGRGIEFTLSLPVRLTRPTLNKA